jgi:hypothetical protein
LELTKPKKDAGPDFTFIDRDGNLVKIQTRSVFSAYRFLGEMLKLREQENELVKAQTLLPDLFTTDPSIDFLYVTHDRSGCWASVEYDGKFWCVPALLSVQNVSFRFCTSYSNFTLFQAINQQPQQCG